MIPVLYEKNESTFTHNGLGTLPDAALCLITEERNGIFELSMNYPVTGLHYGDLQIGRTIKARNAYNGEQLFDIYAISRPMNGLVTINAQHISYRLNQKVLLPCTAGSCTAAMTAIENHILDGSDFDFWTDKTVTANWKCETPKNVRSALGGAEGSVLDVYGPGEYEWDNFDVKFHQHRGADTGVSIRYGKNLVDLVADEDGADVYTACVAYYTAQNGTVVYTSKVKTSEWSATNDLVSTIDMAQFFTPPAGASDSWTPTTSEMETKALQLMTANNVAAVAQNLKVEFELLSQTKEYENLAALERVNLCDTITVTHPGMGVNVKVKVIKTVWNALLDRYDSLELGEPTANFANTITAGLSQSLEDIKAELGDKVDWSHMDIAIANATELITGGAGGYVVLGQNADGEPNEIFIMDAPDQANAVNIIRLNKNGIGFSTQGINGPYTNAWTIDGHLVADFIDTGTLTASIIGAGTLASIDADHNFTLDMTTGQAEIKKGSIKLGHISGNNYNFSVDDTGDMTMKKGQIKLGEITPESLLESGSFTSDGAETANTLRARSTPLPATIETVAASGGYTFAVLAWENGTTWKGYLKTGGTISTGTSNTAWVSTKDIASLRQQYPAYIFRILIKNSTGSTINLNDTIAHFAFTFSSAAGGYNFSVNDDGQLRASDAKISGTITTASGAFENALQDGILRFNYGGEYLGRIGTSLFTQNERAIFMDIGVDADLGGIAVQETSGAAAIPAFYYSRANDTFITEKPITGHGSSITVAEDNGANDGLLIHSDVDVQISAASGVSIGGSGGLHVNGSTATLNGNALATHNWVTGQGYLTSHQSLSGYATQQWVNNQGFLTDTNIVTAVKNNLYQISNNGLSVNDATYPNDLYINPQHTRWGGGQDLLSNCATGQWIFRGGTSGDAKYTVTINNGLITKVTAGSP